MITTLNKTENGQLSPTEDRVIDDTHGRQDKDAFREEWDAAMRLATSKDSLVRAMGSRVIRYLLPKADNDFDTEDRVRFIRETEKLLELPTPPLTGLKHVLEEAKAELVSDLECEIYELHHYANDLCDLHAEMNEDE